MYRVLSSQYRNTYILSVICMQCSLYCDVMFCQKPVSIYLYRKNKSFRPRERGKKGLKNLQSVKTLAGRTQIYSCSSQQVGKARKQPLTVSAQFQQSLHSLMDTLNQANPFFIRCIKSNSHKVSSSILIASQQPSVSLWFVQCTSKNSDCMTYRMFPSHTASIWCSLTRFLFLASSFSRKQQSSDIINANNKNYFYKGMHLQ